MPVTVPLETPVKSVTSARALAESVARAGTHADVGTAIDRILRYLNGLGYPALRREAEGVLDVLHQLGGARAAWATDWLARHTADVDAHAYWAELTELSLLLTSPR